MPGELDRQCKKALQRWHRTSTDLVSGKAGVAQANKAERHMKRVCDGTSLRARVGYYNYITGRTKYYFGKANSKK